MILSRGRGYLFIHIPKTAGTAMALALEARAMRDDILLGDTPKARKRRHQVAGVQAAGRLWKHSSLADLDGLLAPDEARALFVFTLVRNPWDRMVSYYHWLRGQRFSHPAVALAQQLPLEAFVLAPQSLAAWQAWPARRYVSDAQGRDLCRCYIRIERFNHDAAPLIQHLGFALDLPRANTSTRSRDWRPYYSDAAAQAVARAAAEDITRFGYGFDDARRAAP
ncbi:MAG: Type II secretory pathway, pullulanase PulA [Lutimaribacter sp.]